MLTIRRKKNESFYIYPEDLPPGMTVAELFADGEVVVTVKKVRYSEVSLVIHAPKALTIMRDNTKKRI